MTTRKLCDVDGSKRIASITQDGLIKVSGRNKPFHPAYLFDSKLSKGDQRKIRKALVRIGRTDLMFQTLTHAGPRPTYA